MGVATILAIASLVVAAGSAYVAHKDSVAAARAQRQASQTAQAQNVVAQQAQIRDQVRQDRIRRAQIMQASANTGTLGSSGELGGIASLDSQTGANISGINTTANTQSAISGFQNQAQSELQKAETWSSVGQLASSSFNIFSSTPGYQKTMASVFN